MVICLATGAALDADIGPHQGKGSGELSLVHQVPGSPRTGDVMLADALYCNYFREKSLPKYLANDCMNQATTILTRAGTMKRS